MSFLDDFFLKIIDASKNLNQTVNSQKNKVDEERNEELCIEYHRKGWQHDGFDYLDGSKDIVVYWKKEGERRAVQLNVAQQRRWVAYISKQIKMGGS